MSWRWHSGSAQPWPRRRVWHGLTAVRTPRRAPVLLHRNPAARIPCGTTARRRQATSRHRSPVAAPLGECLAERRPSQAPESPIRLAPRAGIRRRTPKMETSAMATPLTRCTRPGRNTFRQTSPRRAIVHQIPSSTMRLRNESVRRAHRRRRRAASAIQESQTIALRQPPMRYRTRCRLPQIRLRWHTGRDCGQRSV